MLFTLSTVFTAFSESAFNLFVPVVVTRVIGAVLICRETSVLIFFRHGISPLKSPAIARLVVVQFPVLLSCRAFSKDFSVSLFIAALIIEAIAKNVASTNQPEYAAKIT